MSSGAHLNIIIIFLGRVIPIINIRWVWDCLVFIMGIPILVRWHLYIEACPGFQHCIVIFWTFRCFLHLRKAPWKYLLHLGVCWDKLTWPVTRSASLWLPKLKPYSVTTVGDNMTVELLYPPVPLSHWQFSAKYSQNTPHSSPMRVKCIVFFVSSNFDLGSQYLLPCFT